MSEKILVTYASRTGWTVGVAEAIGKTLAENGLQVDLLPMHDVKSLSVYSAVVAGSAMQANKWLPEAMQFIHAHQSEFRTKPVAVFSVCMALAMRNGENYRPQVIAWMDPVRALVKPVSMGVFAGGLDIRKIKGFADKLKFRISVLVGVWKEGDHRDWNAIEQWAATIKPLLLNGSPD